MSISHPSSACVSKLGVKPALAFKNIKDLSEMDVVCMYSVVYSTTVPKYAHVPNNPTFLSSLQQQYRHLLTCSVKEAMNDVTR